MSLLAHILLAAILALLVNLLVPNRHQQRG